MPPTSLAQMLATSSRPTSGALAMLIALVLTVWVPPVKAQTTGSEPTALPEAAAGEAEATDHPKSLDQRINDFMEPATERLFGLVFFNVYESRRQNAEGDPLFVVPFILVWLGGAAVFLSIYFRFPNIRFFSLALRTVRGRYSKPDDPGEITHFQALSAAVAATVGLGNIAGVAIAIGLGGPGAAFWMVLMGLLAMSVKFAECTLGVKYRQIGKDGRVHGGPMLYLTRGLAERGMGALGRFLAVIFAVLCVGAAFGGGNMFQVNQACDQLIAVTGGEGSFFSDHRWVFGTLIAVLVGAVILGGITRIARVTAKLVPFMAILYVIGCLVVLGTHFTAIPETMALIVRSAFAPDAAFGGLIGCLLLGIRRAVFSNEAGIGSAPIAHAAVRTRHPASEGVVALLEPFVDTVIICTMTALVIVITGSYSGEAGDGIAMTSHSFGTVVPWFPYVLSAAVILFALSTLISWSYYGQQAWKFLFGHSKRTDLIYKLVFCCVIVVGSAMELGQVIDFSDGMLLGMCFPNLVGVFLLLPVIKKELEKFLQHSRKVDAEILARRGHAG